MGLWSFVRAWSRKFYAGVVVESVTPPYYAGQVNPILYSTSVYGSGFDIIPSDAVAIIANDNDAPLRFRYSKEVWASLGLVSKDDSNMSFEFAEPHVFSAQVYIGAIVSADRTQLYWLNNTKPLP